MEAVTVKIHQLGFDSSTIFREYSEDTFDFSNYKEVYKTWREEGYSPDNAFYEFNIDRPSDFKGHSLSVSDIVEIDGEKFFCDEFGWVRV